jgi:hypothetical protein
MTVEFWLSSFILPLVAGRMGFGSWAGTSIPGCLKIWLGRNYHSINSIHQGEDSLPASRLTGLVGRLF